MNAQHLMMDYFSGGGDSIPPDLIVTASRCWRAARDAGQPVQPSLHAALAPYGCEMLVPVFRQSHGLGRSLSVPPTWPGLPISEGT